MEAQVSEIIGPLLFGFIFGAIVGWRLAGHYNERAIVEFMDVVARRLRLEGRSGAQATAFVNEVIADVRKRTAAIDRDAT